VPGLLIKTVPGEIILETLAFFPLCLLC
jgi:hypothetical protein